MSSHYEATLGFRNSITEVETLITLADEDNENRVLFLKLATVSAVTKFQVFVEEIMKEFRYNLNNKKSGQLSTYSKMNSLKMSLDEGNALMGLKSHNHFTDEKRNRVIQYIQSISYITDDESVVGNEFKFKTKFPLGRTGKNELIELVKQIDGDTSPFASFGEEKFNRLDSILNIRHGIVHQDRFNGTDITVKDSVDFLKELVEYMDEMLDEKMKTIEAL